MHTAMLSALLASWFFIDWNAESSNIKNLLLVQYHLHNSEKFITAKPSVSIRVKCGKVLQDRMKI